MKRAKVKYNGNHYFSGDVVRGRYFEKPFAVNGEIKTKHFIEDVYQDEYGNEFKQVVEVEPKTLEEME